MDLGGALEAHADWRMKFRLAIARQERMDEARISADHCCPLGIWLHGAGRSRFGMLDSYRECILVHAAFHREAGKVAAAINRGNHAIAELMIASDTPYEQASKAVGSAIMRLHADTGLELML